MLISHSYSMNFFIGYDESVPRWYGLVLRGLYLAHRGEDSVCIHHPRLRYAHLGLIRFCLFEAKIVRLRRMTFASLPRPPATPSKRRGILFLLTCSTKPCSPIGLHEHLLSKHAWAKPYSVVSTQATQSHSVRHTATHTTLRVEDTLPDGWFFAITVKRDNHYRTEYQYNSEGQADGEDFTE